MQLTRSTTVAIVGAAALLLAALAGPAVAGTTTIAAQDDENATATPTATPTDTPTATDEPTPTPTPRVGNATVSVDRQVATDSVTVSNAELGAGGYIVVKNSSGVIIGVSDFLTPTTYTNYSVELDQPREQPGVVIVELWFDNGDLSFDAETDNQFTSGGFPVRDTAFVTTEPVSRTTEPTATTVSATTTGGEMSGNMTTTGNESPTETTGPGFGLLVALATLLAAAVLATRR